MASKPRPKREAACFSRFASALSHGMCSETVGVACVNCLIMEANNLIL
jgi:hypothetical protein